ncbi:(S)-ureidoglycine aminohydrolase [Maribius pontilimi]|uniref:(S)-ureidoglycine aminohydrolase n=1 Tax=Palleronia pontilimi TaxID=1964209 RepID=A0A934IGW7_9RHOB|nr:(S)-ureidoglycine aminohydrolase [Palleronia pontilimi]
MQRKYFTPAGGHPGQDRLMTDRSVFTTAYAVIPHGVLQDITTSRLPFWTKTQLWVIARPMTGFSETFSHYLMRVAPGGGSDRPDDDTRAEAVLFFTSGTGRITIAGQSHTMREGSYAYIAPGTEWSLFAGDREALRFHWIRKLFQPVDGLDAPESFVTHEDRVTPVAMPKTDGHWTTTRFVDPEDLRHDMHVNIVSFDPGAMIPFMETHVMEHGLYVLEGKAVYRLNDDWVEVEAGDYLWLRAFCPQACYAGGPGLFRYLLYKDVNRHAALGLLGDQTAPARRR